MTEKRFTVKGDGVNAYCVSDKLNIYPMPILSFESHCKVICTALNDLTDENERLKQENQRMANKLNQLALEFLNYDMVTMGKATEMSEMCYYDFLKYRKENGNPMELKE